VKQNLVLPQNVKGNNNFNKFEEKKRPDMLTISPKKPGVKKQTTTGFMGSTLKTKRVVEIDLNNNDPLKLNQMSGIKIPQLN